MSKSKSASTSPFFRTPRLRWAFLGFWILYFIWFWAHGVFSDQAGDFYIGNANMWGDWALHFMCGSAMAFRSLILKNSPLLYGVHFRYPFAADLISALLIRAGFPFWSSFTVPSFIFSIAAVFALFYFSREIIKDELAAVLGCFIFMLNGGTGIFRFFREVAASRTPFHTLLYPPLRYTHMDELSVYWISIVDSMFIPQRSFAFGFSLALAALLIIYRFKSDPRRPAWRWILVSGLILGLMPVLHTHSFLAVFFILLFWSVDDSIQNRSHFVRERLPYWTALAALVAAIAIPVMKLAHMLEIDNQGFAHRCIGWYAGIDHLNWFVFWWRNWGLTPLAALNGLILLIWKPSGFRNAVIFLPFFFIFALVNLITFQPWPWDNTKLLAWASVGISLLAGYFVAELVRSSAGTAGHNRKRIFFKRAAGAALFVSMIATGTLDDYRILLPSINRYKVYTNEELSLADWFRKNTPIEAVVLTAPYHNNWSFNLTGRQALMTYDGWLWTHGYNYWKVAEDLRTMLTQPTSRALYQKYGVTTVVLGPIEKRDYQPDIALFRRTFQLLKESDNYVIFSATAPPHAAEPPRSAIVDLESPKVPSGNLDLGLVKKIYRGRNFYGKPLVVEEEVADFDFWFNDNQKKPFESPCSITWEGYIQAPDPGIYIFSLESDDGSWLFIDDVLVVENGGTHGARKVSSRARLSPGLHRVLLKYFDDGGGAILRWTWTLPKQQAERRVGLENLFYEK